MKIAIIMKAGQTIDIVNNDFKTLEEWLMSGLGKNPRWYAITKDFIIQTRDVSSVRKVGE